MRMQSAAEPEAQPVAIREETRGEKNEGQENRQTTVHHWRTTYYLLQARKDRRAQLGKDEQGCASSSADFARTSSQQHVIHECPVGLPLSVFATILPTCALFLSPSLCLYLGCSLSLHLCLPCTAAVSVALVVAILRPLSSLPMFFSRKLHHCLAIAQALH